MPELPEVEIIRIGLSQKIVDLKIKKVQVLNPKTFQGDFKLVRGKKVLNVWRRAKILGIELGTLTLLFHLKMTGQLIYEDGKRLIGGHPTSDMKNEMPNKSTRVIFEFSDSSKLFFNDQRKFGWIKVMDNRQLTTDNLLNNLGPEPLEKSFTWKLLKQNLLKHKNLPVKVALMDQQVISGVGNIYANEACFDAKINPKLKVSKLTDNGFKSLHKGVLNALRDGIKHGGSSRAHFVDSEGKKGYFLDYAFVYGRAGETCKICGSAIQKVSLGGRGTYFCPSCQSIVK